VSTADDLVGTVTSPSLALVANPDARPPRRWGPLDPVADRTALVLALRRGDEQAAAAFFREFSPLVERTIGRIVGFDDDLPDATQEAFLRAMRSMDRLRDPQALVDWLLQIAVFTATDWLRSRKRRRWLVFFDPERHQEPAAPDPDDAGRDALRATYRVLDRMSMEERTVFALRFIDGMELSTVASACACSLATAKRRLTRAAARFHALARSERALAPWLEHELRIARAKERS
jgi:RNA polymerase sigma-70 factor (ECF subfamily)